MTENYIPRRLLEREKYYEYVEHLLLWENKFSTLYDLITEGKKKIVLLGDAGYGKSTELRKVSKRWIDEHNTDYIPILVELNTYVDEEIKDYIIGQIGEESKDLLEHSRSRLIFLFDEFDQVLNKEIATRKLKNFIESYDESRFVISCRTNFYSGQFEEFSSFVILPFNSRDILTYVQQRLVAKSGPFLNELKQSSLFEVVKNPFFLKHIVEIFDADNKLPDKPSDIISRIINISLKKDLIRLASKFDLRQRYPITEMKKDLAYISLVMETLQKNYISIVECKALFPDEYKRQVVTELSIMKKAFRKEGDAYQFQHNNFQEELAAEMLANSNLSTILEFISYRYMDKRKWIDKIRSILDYIDVKPFGVNIIKILSSILDLFKYNNNIKRIRPSWANTVAFLCLLRRENDLFEYLMQNEPELALKFETSRVDDAKKERLFRKIFEKYTSKEIPIDRDIDYEELANFARTAGQRAKVIYDYLMNYARSNKEYEKYNAINMLSRMREFKTDEPLRELLIQYIKDVNEPQSTRHACFYALARLGMATPDTIDAIKSLKDLNDDWILSGLYYLIKESTHVDKYVDILLSGIANVRMKLSSAESRLVDEAWNLRQALEKVKSYEGVKKIVRYLIANPEDLREFHVRESMERLVSNFVTVYNAHSTIYADVKELLVTAHKNYIDSESLNPIIVFFKETDTVLTLFKDLFEEREQSLLDLSASIANSQCVEFLLNKYKEGEITDDNMWEFINYLRFNSAHALLLNMINIRTGKFYPAPARDYNKEREEQLKRKVEIIFSKHQMLEEIEYIFKFIGRDELTLTDFDDILHKNIREPVCSDFVVREIRNNVILRKKDKRWTFEELKEAIDGWNYEWFTVSHVFNLLYHGAEIELSISQTELIKRFCLGHLSKVNFGSALSLKDNGDTTTTSYLAVFLWYFLRKLDLDYPEPILLDMLSYDWIEGNGFVGIDYLENKLSPAKLKQRILDNLRKGILVDQVLRNHINYCKKHQCEEARELLYKLVDNHEIKIDTRMLALDTVALFSDSRSFLQDLLNAEELSLFSKAAEILISKDDQICQRKLIDRLKSGNDDFALEAAKFLIEKQNLKALNFYVGYIKRTKKFSTTTARIALSNIQTAKALPMIFDLLRFSFEFDKEIEQDEFIRLDSTVISVLKNISRQNYKNFIKVRRKLQKFIRKYQSRFGNISYLNFVYNDIEKDFYVNFKQQITIQQAIAKVKRIAA